MSSVYRHLFFLRQLSAADKNTRMRLLRSITYDQMTAVSEVVRFILSGSIHVLRQDLIRFRERALLLRQLTDPRISLNRKRNALESRHELVPRLLRPYHLQRAIVLSMQVTEQ